jgi:serine/threonine protein kinase
MDDSEPPVRSLLSSFGDRDGGDFEHLVDVGEFRYHLLLQFNKNELNCPENEALRQLYTGFDDPDATNEAVNECIGVLWPFLLEDYASRKESSQYHDASMEVIKLQVLTTNGILQSQKHAQQLQYPKTRPINNIFTGITTYPSTKITRLDELAMDIYKVKLEGSIYCVKTIHRSNSEDDFVREVSTLRNCSHPNIVRLIGLEINEDKVESMVIEYVQNARSLSDIPSISSELCDKWTAQITHALEYLHERGLVWGDAKIGNVLVDRQNDTKLVDFGGGFTNGWVDMNNCNTVRGDLQGLERIIFYMRERRNDTESTDELN